MFRPVCTTLSLMLLLLARDAAAIDLGVDFEDHRDWLITVSAGGFVQNLNGDFRVGGLSANSTLDIDDTLDMGDDSSFFLEADVQPLRRHHLRFAFLPTEFQGNRRLSQSIVVGGRTYNATDRVTSVLEFDTYEISYRFDIHLGDRVTVAPVLQLSILDGRVEASDRTLGRSEEEKFLLPIPYLGVRAEAYPISRVGVFGEVKGFTIGNTGTALDVEVGGTLHLTRNLFMRASYRRLSYQVDSSGAEVDVVIDGPFLGAGLRF